MNNAVVTSCQVLLSFVSLLTYLDLCSLIFVCLFDNVCGCWTHELINRDIIDFCILLNISVTRVDADL